MASYSLLAGRSKRSPKDSDIKSPNIFHALLAKEKARVDRNYHIFSLVALELVSQDTGSETINTFVDQLKNHIRVTDEIGWLDNHSIGIMLFNASGFNAKQFVEKIQYSCPINIEYKYSISTYPEDKNWKAYSEGVHRGHCECPHSTPGLMSSKVHGITKGQKKAIALHPVFFDKISVRKRFVDILLSTVALVALSPLMLLVAIAVKVTSKGPVFFKQQRAGLGGESFTFLKFRTMKADADEMKSQLLAYNERTGPVFKMENDPRVTCIGKLLRQWSLDELPQFINVLKGDMSLVGPRPPTMDEVEQYKTWHNYRLEIKPGITCIWQVYARHDKSFENWVRLDIKYRKEQSFLLDMKLIALTLPAVLSRRGAC